MIPPEIIDRLTASNCVLFLGNDLPSGNSGPPSRIELAHQLAQLGGFPLDDNLAIIARQFETRFGRRELNQKVIDLLAIPAYHPTPLHEQIVALPFQAILTTVQDQMLEAALRAAGREYATVLSDVEVPYIDEHKVMVYKLLGCISRPASLVLTLKDQVQLTRRLNPYFNVLRYLFATRQLLFIHYNLEDYFFAALFHEVTADVEGHRRRVYAIWPKASPELVTQWEQDGLVLMSGTASLFLDMLARQMDHRKRTLISTKQEHLYRLPYKFLDFYTRQDSDIFYGRQIETVRFFRMTLSHRLVVLFGASGTGKTSLLNAGVAPLLEEQGYTFVYVRALDDPRLSIRSEVLRVLKQCGRIVTDPGGTSLLDFFRTVLDPQDKLVIVLDQFEEFFLRLGDNLRQHFWIELAAFRDQPLPTTNGIANGVANLESEVRFVLSLREDYFPQLDEARNLIPELLSDSYRLTNLTDDKASTIITEPAARVGLTLNPDVVTRLLDDLRDAGMIAPPQLQIVCYRLIRDCLLNPDDALKDTPIRLAHTIVTLETYQRLGEARGMLAAYVNDELARLPNDVQRQLARAILKVLVTSQATKAIPTLDSLHYGLTELGVLCLNDTATMARIDDVLAILVNRRLVREFESGGLSLYELAHDHMVKEIHTWIDQADMQTKLARELLRREMETWQSTNILLSLDGLRFIHEQAEKLHNLSRPELELLFRSALSTACEVPYWFERARSGGVQVEEILLSGLVNENFRVRAATVASMASLGIHMAPIICNMLADGYPQVRVAAIKALEKLQPSGEWRINLKYECFVPAGNFIMGVNQLRDDEGPAHEYYLHDFYISKYPVTNIDYKRFMQDCNLPWDLPTEKAEHPVVNITWYQARNYAGWAGMRLVTEAEWEKAASWNTRDNEILPRKLSYPWGNIFDKNCCNTKEFGIEETTPVGKYSPHGDSPYGVADMSGNVWEWTNSLYEDYPYHANDIREESGISGNRVLRGGSFYLDASYARCTYRLVNAPQFEWRYYGLRCGLSVKMES